MTMPKENVINRKVNLSKKNDFNRRRHSFKKHALIILKPFTIASLLVGIWYQFQKYGLHFSHEDEVALTGAIITTLAVAYAITATLVLSSIYEKCEKVVRCVFEKDKNTFLYYRDERIPIIIHLLLLTLAIMLIGMIIGLEYKHLWSGVAAVFSVSFALSLYSIVIIELQNPAKSLWLIERIPSVWLTVDVDEHFKLDDEK